VARARTRLLAALLGLALFVPPPQALALLNIDGTRNQIFVFGTATFSYDSNIFAQKEAQGDYAIGASAGVELKRRAGIIAVNARAVFDYQRFNEFTDQTSWNPSFFAEFNKTSGRTTGALTINAFRTSRADTAINIRTQTWNFPIGLNLKYPINDKYYVTSQTGYLRRSYVDAEQLLGYTDFTQSFDLFYVYTSKLDLLAGYRLRRGETSLGTTTDHNLTVGAANGLLPKVNGTVRVGYQFRNQDYSGETYDQFTMMAGVAWTPTRKITVSGSVATDFTTTAIGGSVDTFSAMARLAYTFTRKFSVDGGIGYGRNKFLGGAPRQDESFMWDAGFRYSWNQHFEVGGSYNYLRNWSTSSFSDFERSGYSVNVSSRF
jgi:hypothetical protein